MEQAIDLCSGDTDIFSIFAVFIDVGLHDDNKDVEVPIIQGN